jgi:hypothetical protein
MVYGLQVSRAWPPPLAHQTMVWLLFDARALNCFCVVKLKCAYPGAAIIARNSVVDIKNCFFIDNQAMRRGRGAAIFSLNSSINIHNSVFFNHRSLGNGGVIYAAQNSDVDIRHSYFQGLFSIP